ncbi:anthrone oxygenase family protein [Gordonia sp. CPCC 205515]|uniref:anthrone oxygenase family protein n=1 Tax=Gordonia sp. CPCC 205515 TaxID=3140791 RepID=UPI003AF36C16
MTAVRDTVLLVALTTVGLIAGLLSAFAYSVMPGLNRAGAQVAVPAMQRINVAIQNPLFGLILFCSIVFSILAVLLWWREPVRWWLLAGLVLYLVAVLITGLINVPLNDRLDAAGAVTPSNAPTVWTDFVEPWVRWNIIRAVAAVAAFVTMIAGLLQLLR